MTAIRKSAPTVYFVGNEESVRDSLAWMIRSRGWGYEVFPSADAFLEMLDSRPEGRFMRSPSCLLLGVHMPGMTELPLFDHLIERELTKQMPIVFLAERIDIRMAVHLIKRGAFDLLQKPFAENVLIKRMEQALNSSAKEFKIWHEKEPVRQRFNRLSERERNITMLLINGRSNEVIAEEMNLNTRTVEFHRSRVLEKMGVNALPELFELISDIH